MIKLRLYIFKIIWIGLFQFNQSIAQNYNSNSDCFQLSLLNDQKYLLSTNYHLLDKQYDWGVGNYYISGDSIICMPSGFVESTSSDKCPNNDSIIINVYGQNRSKLLNYFIKNKRLDNAYFSDSLGNCVISKCELIATNKLLLGGINNGFYYKLLFNYNANQSCYYFEIDSHYHFYGEILNDLIFIITKRDKNIIKELKLLDTDEVGIRDYFLDCGDNILKIIK